MKEGHKYWASVVAMIFLGMIFIIAGMGKLLAGSKAFEPFVSPAFLPQPFVEVIYVGLPYIEIIVGTLLILGVALRFATYLSLALISCFISLNVFVLYSGLEPCGGCFGVFGGLTAISALILDVIMVGMVAVILVCYRGSFFNIIPMALNERRA